MTGISIKEWGLRFVWESFQEYWGHGWLPVLFLAVLIGLLIARDKKALGVFGGYTVFLLLTIYNPWIVVKLVPKLGFEKEYYRFYWILPVIPGIAYGMTRIVFAFRKGWQRAVAAVVFAALIVVIGKPIPSIVNNFSLAKNIYKVPDDLRAAVDVIHNDGKKESPRVLFDNSLNYYICQYDSSIEPVINRDVMLYHDGSKSVHVSEDTYSYQVSDKLMNWTYGQQETTPEQFAEEMKKAHADYMVMPVTLTNHELFREAGCVAIAQTENYVVYRFG